jgi:LysR family carnitine catabolism transcriptional activator
MIDLSTRGLRAMIALDDLRHFSLAAERCNITQSALSQMVAKLERDVDLRLVDRDRRRVSLTPEGQRFVAVARRVMADLEGIDADLREHVSLTRGRLSISALPSLAAHWLPPLLARYRARYPDIQVELFDTPPERALELVRHKRVDFALTGVGPGLAGLHSELLFEERFYFVCGVDHKLAGRKRVALSQLAGCALIRLIRSGSIARHLEHALSLVAVRDTGLEVEQLATLSGLVASGLGVGIVPHAAVPYFDKTRVAVIPISDAQLTRSIYVVRPTASAWSPAARGFVEMMQAGLPGAG